MKPSLSKAASAAATPEALCPSCERFIGPADLCPYCGADSARRPLLRHLRRAALVLAVVGVGGLLATAIRSEPPAIKIREISPRMNFGYVRVAGKVMSEPKVFREGGDVNAISVTIGDGTGQLRLQADGPVALALAKAPGIPGKGTRVEAAGTLSVSSQGLPRLRLQSAMQLRVVVEESGRESPKRKGDES